ncbi:hypothetical protein H6F32_14220 [Anabaena sp. FACHB-1237]|uniref:DUF6918 family protein n=1 Tax=Anabaena sp. FACHB-1237 TaxID=2692769 RepID=UPI0016804706|nr:hypothetical protein [Anabaena sp. FACHB-1237]MBD2138712.1 hypothetical protein [Anabaena sp. FACHB-1237]
MALIDGLSDNHKKQILVDDCINLLETQVAAMGGISGLAIKAGYAAVKGISPDYCAGAIARLLPEFLMAFEDKWQDAVGSGDAVTYLVKNSDSTADVLLSLTDKRIEKSSNSSLKAVYGKLRKSAKKHVEEAVPSLAKVIDNYSKL